MPRRKILLIGWDAADWKVLHPLMDAGYMPAFSSLVEGGVMANLTTLHPILSPMLWTSIATGKRPFQHRILGFTEPAPDGSGVQPVSNRSRKSKALWNVLQQEGWRCNVVGWWPSHPAEPISGVMVSNHYGKAQAGLEHGWPMLPGSVHPPELAGTLAELRLHPNEILAEDVLPFVPDAASVDQDKDPRIAMIAKITAEASSVHSAATWLMEETEWDLMAVYYDAIDHYCHGFMRYHPPRRDFVREADYELYKGVIEAGYRFHDLLLGRLLSLVDDDATVVLCSDHGFHPDHLRPRSIPREPAGPAAEHRRIGVLVMRGPGLRSDAIVHGASLLDVKPTILTLAGLPCGEDMDGKPLLDVFEDPPEVEWIPSWEERDGDDGRHPADARSDPADARAAMEQLVALGYVDAPSDDREQAIEQSMRELRYNEARSYMDAMRRAEAAVILEELRAKAPDTLRFGMHLALGYRALGRNAQLRRLVEALRHEREAAARRAADELAHIEEERAAAQSAGDASDEGRTPLSARDRRRIALLREELVAGTAGATHAAATNAHSSSTPTTRTPSSDSRASSCAHGGPRRLRRPRCRLSARSSICRWRTTASGSHSNAWVAPRKRGPRSRLHSIRTRTSRKRTSDPRHSIATHSTTGPAQRSTQRRRARCARSGRPPKRSR